MRRSQTDAQKRAAIRNHIKMRLMGFNTNISQFDTLTPSEENNISVIRSVIGQIVDHWDENTEALVGHKLPPYKCYWCGRRQYTGHLVDWANGQKVNVCTKHFKEISKYP